jgi:hypothetical protein
VSSKRSLFERPENNLPVTNLTMSVQKAE